MRVGGVGPALRRWRWLAAAAAAVALATVGAGLLRARLEAPPPTLMLTDRTGRFLGEIGAGEDGRAGYWPLATIPRRVAAATILVEDHRFWRHPGVDPAAVLRAAWQDLRSGRRVSGASTLAMQVARLQRPAPRTLRAKAVEAVTAIALTARYGREAVLRHYLRIVPYGNRIHGIAYAARRYLDKPVEDLSWAEVAFLAAIPQAPARMNPLDPAGRRRAVARAQRILRLLARHGDLGPGELRAALVQLQRLRIPRPPTRPGAALHAVLGLERRLAPHRLELARRNPVVRTTLDLELQEALSASLLEALERWESRGAGNAALVVVDLADWSVRAWVGSSDYFDRAHAGAIDYARVPRSPGSVLKPFLYALALERGIVTPRTVLDDLGRGAGGIGNADGLFLGPMLPRTALANSRNVPAADLLADVGVERFAAFLARLGLGDGSRPAAHWGLGLAIGNMPVTLEHVLEAYTVFPGGGTSHPLRWLAVDPVGTGPRLLSRATARRIALFLSDPMARLPTFPRMGALEYPFPVAVKTGTSSGYHDAWTVAWSRRYLVGAWAGHPDYRPMAGLSGYRSAARLVRDALLRLHPGETDGLDDSGFPPPAGTQPVRLCALTGAAAGPACDRVVVEPLGPGDAPAGPCTAHVRIAIDTRTGRPATAATPPRAVETRTFVDLGPRYAAWQRAAGLPFPPAPAPFLPGRPAGAAPATRLAVLSPEPGLTLVLDPDTPPRLATLALRARIEPAPPQAVWSVDGTPFATVDPPFTARWPLAPGDHTVQLWIPATGQRSRPVPFTVLRPGG